MYSHQRALSRVFSARFRKAADKIAEAWIRYKARFVIIT
jgi:hypothetical protein